MNRLVALVGLVLALVGQPAFAQDIAGHWQGTLHDGQNLRVVLQISKTPSGEFSGALYSIDQSRSPLATVAVILKGSQFNFDVPGLNGNYTGELTADAKSVKGTWIQNARSLPLDLVKPGPAEAWVIDPSPHKASFVTTSDGVKLEVLDWGGTGKPLVMIAGLGADAHVFDKFVTSFAGKYHVYGVTRRGYGASDRPDPTVGNYMADRLGDDVLYVIDALKLEKPVLAGWSIGGQELSSIGSRYPEKVSGLVYLDAGYAYSFYSPGNLIPPGSNLFIDANDIKAKISRLNTPGVGSDQALAIIDELLNTAIPQLQADLLAAQSATRKAPPVSTGAAPPPPETPGSRISRAILVGAQKYTKIDVPILAIFASAQPPPPTATDAERANYEMRQTAGAEQAKRFEAGLPQAKVVVIANAQHAVFSSHPEDVAREMSAFIDGLN